MPISFIPALDKPTTLQLPLHPVNLTFAANFSTREEYWAARNSKVRVELWSDIPQQGKQDGQWSSLVFQWSSEALVLTIPSTVIVHPWKTRFSFTYRLVYPNGQIKWLGEYGRNGILVVEKKDERLQLGSGWLVDQSGFVFSSTQDNLGLNVANLADTVEWSIWSFGTDSIPRLQSLNDELLNATSALLIPRQSLRSIVPLSPILLTSRGDTTFSVGRSGSITIHASVSGVLSLQNPSSADLKTYISSVAGSQFIDCDSSEHVITLTLPQKSLSVNPAHLSIIPLSSSTQCDQLDIPLSFLKSRFPPEITEVVLYSPSSAHAQFESIGADACTVTPSFGGSQLLVSPVYEVTQTDSSKVKITILVPHTRDVKPVHAHRLPTPPPSPPLQFSQMQPLRFPDAKLEGTPKQSVIAFNGLQATQHVGLIRRLFGLYTGLLWWLLRAVLRRLFVFKVRGSTRASGSGASTPVGEPKSGTPSRSQTGTVTPTTLSGCHLGTVSTVPGDQTHADPGASTVQEQRGDQHRHPLLTFDIPSVQGPVQLIIGGLEGNVNGLKFGTGEAGDQFATLIEKLSGTTGETWLVKLADASGKLTIR